MYSSGPDQPSQLLSIELDPSRSLAIPSEGSPLHELLELAEKIHSGHPACRHIRAVMIIQRKPCKRWPWGDFVSLHTKVLRDELRRAIVQVRLLIRYIRNSPVSWIYLSWNDCFGPYYEIARACDRLLFLEHRSKVGFPELNLGLFPLGGWFESELRRKPRQLEFWQRRPIQDPILSREHDRFELLIQWQNLDPTDSNVLKRLDEYAGKFLGHSKNKGNIRDPLIAHYQLWLKQAPRQSFRLQATEQNQDLIELARERLRKSSDELEFSQWFVDIAGHIISSHSFLTKLAWPQPTLVSQDRDDRVQEYKAFLIDLRGLRPPIQIIEHLLRLKRPIVFFDESAAELRRSLELIYGHLSKSVHHEWVDLWRRYVSWFVSPRSPKEDPGYPILSCGLQETISWQVGESEHHAWIVDSHWDRQLYLELDQSFQDALPWSDLTGAKLIVSTFSESELPWVHLIRSWALEEMIEAAKEYPGGMLGLMQDLKNVGWGFLGDEFLWERFVTRRLTLAAYQKDLSLGAKLLRSEAVDINPWKLVRTIKPNEHILSPMSKTRLSLHFLQLASLIWANLCSNPSSQLSREAADMLVSRALGVPENWGRISVFVESWGLRRCQVYTARNWPELLESMINLKSGA